MATMTFCPICGGVRASADARVNGRRCSCTQGGGTATATATTTSATSSSTTSAGVKTCSVCGTDVTNKKRMKDSTSGRYWCYDCYVLEQQKKTQGGMTMRCPHCNKDYPPLRMIKHGEVYWCDLCSADTGKKKKKTDGATGEKKQSGSSGPAPRSTAEPSSKSPMLIGFLVVLVLGAVAYYMFIL